MELLVNKQQDNNNLPSVPVLLPWMIFRAPGCCPRSVNGRHTSKHLFEVFLQPGDVLTVPNDLQQILISNKVEPNIDILKNEIHTILL